MLLMMMMRDEKSNKIQSQQQARAMLYGENVVCLWKEFLLLSESFIFR
jgi:hypothetical protein